MAIMTLLPQMINSGDTSGKVFDNPGYENALKESGWSADEANAYWSDLNNRDPYAKAGKDINKVLESQAPTISIQGNDIVISAPQTVLDSPLVQQIDEQLQSLKGADLRSAEVSTAIDALNKEIRSSLKNWMVEDTFGWTPEEFQDYQRLIQIVNVPNVLSSKETLKAKRPGGDFYRYGEDSDKAGQIMELTPKQWIDYWRSIFNEDKRTDMFLKSLQSDDPYERVMAMIMSKGEENPVYGYDQGERIKQMFARFGSEFKKVYEGLINRAVLGGDAKRVDNLAKKLELAAEDIIPNEVSSDDDKEKNRYEASKKEIDGKSWDELTDKQRGFLLKVAVSRENAGIAADQRDMLNRGGGPGQDIENMSSDDKDVSRDAIKKILSDSSYDRYKDVNINYGQLVYVDNTARKEEERFSKNSIWSAWEQKIGSFAGTLFRYWFENALVRELTGFSMNKISDEIGERILDGLIKLKVPISSRGSAAIVRFIGNLVGSIPEDILQTTVDSVMTNSEDDITAEGISENFKNNLIFMALFNGARAGWSAIKKAKIIKELMKKADLDTTVDIGLVGSDATDAAKTYEEGGHLETDGTSVYKVNADGTREKLENTTPEQAEIVRKAMEGETPTGRKVTGGGDGTDATLKAPDFDDAARAANDAASAVDDAGKAAGDGTGTTKVDVDTPDGRVETEIKDYSFKSDSPDDVLDTNIKIEPTKAGVKQWGKRALNAIMRNAQTNLFNEFRARFGNDITTADFDWVLYNTRRGLSPDQIIGTKIPGTGRVVTQNTIDALKWWGDQPAVKIPRMLSLKALGKNVEDYNYLGYLPHTSYDPWVVPFEEGKAGQLWQQYTGKSMMNDSGEYVGYGGTLEGRYRTFLSNMLWDIKNKEIQAARLIEDAALDGKKLAPDEAMKMVEGWEQIQDNVTNPKKSKSMNNLEKGALADGDGGKSDFEAANEAFREEAPNSGITKAMNKNFADMYIGSGRGTVEQPKNAGEVIYAVGDQSQTMRSIKVNGVSMYDAGAADIVYAPQNAKEFVLRWMREGADPNKFRSYLTDYIRVHSNRSPKYIEPVVDRIISRIAKENPNGVTEGGLIKTLTKAFRSEGYNRLRRWTTLADYDQFSKSTAKFMDSFWYRHMQLDGLTSNKNIIAKIAGALGDLATEARYDALFYMNFKNSLLQTSELSRLYTEFKWGDVATMLRKMATDADFREKVDMYVEAVAPETGYVRAGLYEDYGNAAESMKVKETETVFGKMRNAKDTVDSIALAPINAAESLKNRTIVAALVAEADRLEAAGKIKGGNEKLMYIRRRFERVALAQNEMGRIGLATNPFAKPFLFLQNFQIRELGMNWYNIVDPDDLLEGTKLKNGKIWNAIKYITKVLGAKLGTTLILSRLGYSAAQTMGLDPLGLVGNYDRLDDEEKTWLDEQISGGILTPLFAGGLTSLFADMYFMGREAYEESNRTTIEDEAGVNLNRGFAGGADWSAVFNPEYMGKTAAGFIPGNVFANRIGQMNEMMDTGWALSDYGNKMYTAPTDPLNTILGYLFGRSATQNAQNYRQTYGDDLGQTLGRIWRGVTGQGTTFDPIDTKNYSDWFDGSENDLQQFEKGKRWFIDERDRILDTYQKELQDDTKYGDIYESEAKANMTKRLDELFEKLGRFVNAYEQKHGTISGKMVKELLGVLNVERESVNDNSGQTSERGTTEYAKAKERYAQLGLPAVGYYSGPSVDYPGTSTDESKAEVKYKGSPQWQVSSTSKYTLQSELAAVLEAGDAVLQDYRKELKDLYSEAVQSNNYTEFNKAQNEYLKAFDIVVGPIVATYGVGALNDDEVKAQLEKMLSTSSNSGKNIGNLVPYKQYATDKYGRVRSVPNESINVVKWAMERYGSDVFKNPTVRSYSTAQEDIDAIKRLAANGENEMAWARALVLKVRIDNQKRSLSKDDYQWLLNFLNNGGQQ